MPLVLAAPPSALPCHKSKPMTNPTYPPPPRPTLDDLDPESATTDRPIPMVHVHREGQAGFPFHRALDFLIWICGFTQQSWQGS